MRSNSELKEKLKEKLKEIFQFENEELDFGIYRIMNYKRKEIEKFIDEELIDEIKKQLQLISEEEIRKVKEEIEQIKQRIKENLGESAFVNGELREEFKNFPLGREYYEKKRQLEEIKISEDLEKEIYNHLINFFSRYYDNGDFISKRRYGKKEKYCIPYNGEEVLLYWANRDQYYIKTTEYFKKYVFKVKNLIVNFKVIEVQEEKGNVKAQEKKFFVLNERVFDFDEQKRELSIYFEYRALTDKEKEKYKKGNSVSQDKANEETIRILEEKIPQNSLARLIFEKEGEKTVIEKHLYKYTRRNTTDFFIHKDLKGFLEREMDFYIKNEFLRLEDLQVLEQSGYFDKLRLYLIGVRAFRNIALKIIEFLAQIENFQKRLWEKKKFVIDTHYVITLDKIEEYVGEEFLGNILDEILGNRKQLEEWKNLFGIEVKSKGNLKTGETWKKLPIDTKYFDEDFKWKLLVSLTEKNDLDEILDGVLINSENWQALNLLLNKYYEKVQTIYIDPPFNKEQEADYLYKVGYKDATWITMLENRIRLGKELLNEKGNFFLNVDDNGNMYARILLDELFGKDRFKNEIIWCYEKPGGPTDKLKNNHSTILFYSATQDSVFNPVYVPRKGESELTRREGRFKTDYEGKLSPDWWVDIPSFATMMTAGERVVKSLGIDFTTQQPEKLLKRIIEISDTGNRKDIILDFFAGSGVTTAVAHKLRRKWIGIEMGEHFWTIILPRMKKVLFYDKSGVSKEKDVKEKYNEKTAGGFFKYHTLEQYEDALENIEFEPVQPTLYEFLDYFVKYMLEWETKKSKTFLNIDELKDPFNYKLKIIDNYQQKIVNVDVVETFNYLLGLHVKGYKVLEDNGRKYIFVFGEKNGKRIAIVWRSIKNIDFEKDKEVIENMIQCFNPDEIYINGDAIVKNFKVIEPIFKFLMFEGVY